MPKNRKTSVLGPVLALVFVGLGGQLAAQQQFRLASDVDRRVGPRTEFQKPIAFDVGDHTLLFEGVVIGGGTYLFNGLNTQALGVDEVEKLRGFYEGLFDLRLSRKLTNGLSYGFDGRLLAAGAEERGSSADGRFDVYLRSRYGQISYGDFEDRNSILLSGRTGLSGEANLFFDGFFDPSFDRAFRYRGRFGSFLVDAAIDDDGDQYNVGLLYRSPTRTRKDSWSFDYHGADDYLGRYERDGVTLGYGVSHGSLDLKFAGALDRFEPHFDFPSFDRISGSFCANYKLHAFTWSAGILVAETNGGELETAYTAGMRYDLARGMSLNAGWFHVDSESTGSDGNPVAAGIFSGIRTSISYRF